MATMPCLDCGREIDFGSDPWEGQRMICRVCGAGLEVINLDPFEVDWVYDEDESCGQSDDWILKWEAELVEEEEC